MLNNTRTRWRPGRGRYPEHISLLSNTFNSVHTIDAFVLFVENPSTSRPNSAIINLSTPATAVILINKITDSDRRRRRRTNQNIHVLTPRRLFWPPQRTPVKMNYITFNYDLFFKNDDSVQ